jgi:hypothetical protein
MGSEQSTQASKPGVLVVHKYYEDCVKLKFYPENRSDGEFFYLAKSHSNYDKYLEHINQGNVVRVLYYEEKFDMGIPKRFPYKVQNFISRLNVIKLPELINITQIENTDEIWACFTTDKGEKYFCKKGLVDKLGSYACKAEVSRNRNENRWWRLLTEAKPQNVGMTKPSPILINSRHIASSTTNTDSENLLKKTSD